MKTVEKYPVQVTNAPTVMLPKGAQVLSFQSQRDEAFIWTLFIWALVDTSQPPESRQFFLQSTGDLCVFDETCVRFVGTAQLREGAFVFHLFEQKPEDREK